MKRRDWALLVSLMAAQTTLILGIGAFAFLRLEARMDRLETRMDRFEARMDRMEARIEERLDDLDRRVARIEGILRIQADADAEPPASAPSDAGSAGSSGQAGGSLSGWAKPAPASWDFSPTARRSRSITHSGPEDARQVGVHDTATRILRSCGTSP